MAQDLSQSRASVLLATSHSNSIVHAIPGYPASSPGRPFVRRSATSSGSHLDLHYSTLLLTHSSPERPPTLFYYYFPSA